MSIKSLMKNGIPLRKMMLNAKKIRVVLLCAYAMLMILSAVSSLLLASCPSYVGEPLDRELSELVVSTLIPDASLWEYVGLEIPGERNVSVDGDAVRLRIIGGQAKLNNGVRAEISLDYPFA